MPFQTPVPKQQHHHRHSLTTRKVHRTRSSGATHHIWDDPMIEVILFAYFAQISFVSILFDSTLFTRLFASDSPIQHIQYCVCSVRALFTPQVDLNIPTFEWEDLGFRILILGLSRWRIEPVSCSPLDIYCIDLSEIWNVLMRCYLPVKLPNGCRKAQHSQFSSFPKHTGLPCSYPHLQFIGEFMMTYIIMYIMDV